jgi:hypothetical protein
MVAVVQPDTDHFFLKGAKSPVAVREKGDQTHRYECLIILNVDRNSSRVGAAHGTTYQLTNHMSFEERSGLVMEVLYHTQVVYSSNRFGYVDRRRK